jgi:threonine synthase
MADLFEREERFTVLPNDLATVEAAVRGLVGRNTV